MGWLYLTSADAHVFQEAIREIDHDGSNRAVGVVAPSFVEDHLTKLIRSRIQKSEPEGAFVNEMFQPSGALGNFGTKINLGFFMGLYSERARKELNTIQNLRNDFAHKLAINSFEIESISARCKNLTIWEECKIKLKYGLAADPRGLSLTIGKTIESGEQDLGIHDLLAIRPDKATPRERFTAACKFYIGAFSILINDPRPTYSSIF